jgi:IclR family acetate operon transcriptional repressor
VKALDRALRVLTALAERPGLGLSDLGRELGEAPATLHRILATLAAHDMAETDAEQGWHIGPGAFRVGSAFLRRTSLVARAQPILRSLMEETGETANLGVVRGGEVLFLAQAETHAAIRAFFPPGALSPLHSSGIGKAVLAALPPARRIATLTGPLEGFTPHTLTTEAALTADLAATAARGWAVDAEERHEGMRCIACAVRDPSGAPVAGLSVSGPAARMQAAGEERVGRAVVAHARELSAALGAG